MPYKYVIYEKKDRIAYVTFNRPESMNAVFPPMHRELWDIWCDFRDDPEVWVAIVTGAGEKAFSAGNDLKYTVGHRQEVFETLQAIPGGFGGITNRFYCNKPIIAAVNGFALGGGFEMALACDLIIAADHARFGLPEPRVGLMAGAGGVHRLARQVGLKQAMGVILTGRHMTAQEALRMGVVNEVVPMKDLIPTAERWAGEILKCAPLSVRASKESVMQGLGLSIETALNMRFHAHQMMMQSEDSAEGPKAFAEKRQPQWKGR